MQHEKHCEKQLPHLCDSALHDEEMGVVDIELD